MTKLEQLIDHYAEQGIDVRKRARVETVTVLVVSGATADRAGSQVLRALATVRGTPVKVKGKSERHHNRTYAPFTKAELRKLGLA